MAGQFNGPVVVMNANMKRETGRKAQLGNITAGKAVASLVRTSLGPKAMLKMLLSASGGIVITNDGNAILREIEVSHPAAKSIIELSRVQDEEVGDGTTSVIVLTGEMLYAAEACLVQRNLHPTEIIRAYQRALEDILVHINSISWKVDLNNRAEMTKVVECCLGTKFTNRWSKIMVNLSLDSVAMVAIEKDGRKEVDTKRYVRIEKLPGGDIEDSSVLRGVMFNKDVTHAKMRRRIEKPRILLLDCTLEYKKGESATSAEINKEGDFEELLRQEEEQITRMCADILKFKPDLVITEKGMSDLCQHIFVKHNISGLRRLKKTDTNRIARATGATIVNRTDEIKESDIGTGAGLFEVTKIGDEYYSYITDCKDPKACTIVLRGASKDVLNEVERNLHDSLAVTRNVYFDARLVTGGGAVEVSASVALAEKAKTMPGKDAFPYEQMARALEVIPRTLTQNCGGNAVKLITELRAKYATAKTGDIAAWGVDGNKGVAADLRAQGIWEPMAVKVQSIKTSIEAACMLLRVDDIVSGSKKSGGGGGGGGDGGQQPEEMEQD